MQMYPQLNVLTCEAERITGILVPQNPEQNESPKELAARFVKALTIANSKNKTWLLDFLRYRFLPGFNGLRRPFNNGMIWREPFEETKDMWAEMQDAGVLIPIFRFIAQQHPSLLFETYDQPSGTPLAVRMQARLGDQVTFAVYAVAAKNLNPAEDVPTLNTVPLNIQRLVVENKPVPLGQLIGIALQHPDVREGLAFFEQHKKQYAKADLRYFITQELYVLTSGDVGTPHLRQRLLDEIILWAHDNELGLGQVVVRHTNRGDVHEVVCAGKTYQRPSTQLRDKSIEGSWVLVKYEEVTSIRGDKHIVRFHLVGKKPTAMPRAKRK